MQVKLFINKNINENANYYFEKSKKLKKKIPGILETIENTKKEIENFENEKELYLGKREIEKKLSLVKKKEWYEKFRWTKTSSGLLLVFGRDATSNETLIKKHAEENDLIFHTDAPGSPFGILKGGKKGTKQDFEEAGQIICCFSSQWKKGFGTADAFYIESNQVSKKAESGEYMQKGSFMIRGKKNILKNVPLKMCLGVIENKVEIDEEEHIIKEGFSGTEGACKKFCKVFVKLEPGDLKPKKLAGEIKKKLKFTIEDLPKLVPQGVKLSRR